MSITSKLKQELNALANPEKAKVRTRLFKTRDRFLGLTVPQQRKIAKKHTKTALLSDLQQLFESPVHEHRFTTLVILNNQFQKTDEAGQKDIYNFYLKNTPHINNWDLVDVSAPKIVGGWLLGRPNERKILHQLAKSKSLWERRITILSTLAFIREKQFEDTLKIAEILLNDNHNLIHKTVGWMLREIGKRNQAVEENFLKKHHQKMPRTMLRYAIERLPEKKRKWYLKR